MDTQSLQAFLAVAETQSFSRAAEQLHLTQPAVSKRIATLEDLLGTRLFDRIGRRIALTEAGNVLLPKAQRILFTVEDSRRALANLWPSGRQTDARHQPPYWFAPAAAAIKAVHPAPPRSRVRPALFRFRTGLPGRNGWHAGNGHCDARPSPR